MGVLTCSVAFLLFNQPSLLNRSADVAAESERQPADELSDRSPITKDEARPDVDSIAADLTPEQLSIAQDHARIEDTGPREASSPNDTNQNLACLLPVLMGVLIVVRNWVASATSMWTDVAF